MSTETVAWLERPPVRPIGRDFMTDAIARVRSAVTGRPHSPRKLKPLTGKTLYDEWLAYAEKSALSHAPSSSRTAPQARNSQRARAKPGKRFQSAADPRAPSTTSEKGLDTIAHTPRTLRARID